MGVAGSVIATAAAAVIHAGDDVVRFVTGERETVKVTITRAVTGRASSSGKGRYTKRPSRRRYKGSSLAKRAARGQVIQAKASTRARLAHKRLDAIANGLVRDLVARHHARMPVHTSLTEQVELGARRTLRVHERVLERVGTGYVWRATGNIAAFQLTKVA